MTTAAKPAIQVTPLFHRHLQALINRVVPLASSVEEVKLSYHQKVEMSVEATQELCKMVDARNTELQQCSFSSGSTQPGNRVRCISPGLWSNLEGPRIENRRLVVNQWAGDAHQLSGSSDICQREEGCDEESRTVRYHCNWMIHPQLFAQIERRFGG